MIKRVFLIAFAATALAGCGSGEANVAADEEKMFKNPGPVDRSKIPANVFETKGPAFIGEPSKGSGAGAAAPPAAVKTGG